MAPHELQAIEKTMSSEVGQLDEIQSQVTAPHRTNDIGPLLHFSRTSDQRERQWRWYLTIPAAFYILVTLGFVFTPYGPTYTEFVPPVNFKMTL